MVTEIKDRQGRVMALVVRGGPLAQAGPNGVAFYTDPAAPLQLAGMRRPKGSVVHPHMHRPGPRLIEVTAEVLIIVSGRVRVVFHDFNDPTDGIDGPYQHAELGAGCAVVLLSGGHSVDVLETAELWEVKQGPFVNDKVML